MAKYHLNPTTGEPGLCRAKDKCPYGVSSLHYGTKTGARAGFELEEECTNLLRDLGEPMKQEVNRGVRFTLASKELWDKVHLLYRRHEELWLAASELKKAEGESQAWAELAAARQDAKNHLDIGVKYRNQVSHFLDRLEYEERPVDTNFTPVVMALRESKLIVPSGGKRVGFSNDIFDLPPEAETILRELDEVGAQWLKSLTTSEVLSIRSYCRDSVGYAEAVARGGRQTPGVRLLHEALAKAPQSSEPVWSYAGVSSQRAQAVLKACLTDGELDLTRVQSSSLNPAILNSFMHPDWSLPEAEQHRVALEFHQSTLAPVTLFRVNHKEIELLIPPGRYRVVGQERKVPYYWEEGGLGTTADYVFQLEPLD